MCMVNDDNINNSVAIGRHVNIHARIEKNIPSAGCQSQLMANLQ